MNRFKTLAVIVLVSFGVAACSAPDYSPWPPITFNKTAKLPMAVSNVNSTSTFRSSYDLPRVENEMPVTPEAVVQRWASDRIVATNEGSGTLTYTVTDAKVTAYALETDQTLKAWFTDEQAVRYEIHLAAEVAINDPAASAAGKAEASANRSITVPEKATLNTREQALYDMIKATAMDLDKALEANMRQHLANWVR